MTEPNVQRDARMNYNVFVREQLWHVKPVLKTLRSLAWHARSVYRLHHLRKQARPICIEVGAGAKAGRNGWTTIDINGVCDICWDLRNGLPLPDSSVAKIYSSHFLEHLTYDQAQRFLAECLRVLVTGGVFSIAVPNARIFLEAYLCEQPVSAKELVTYQPAYKGMSKIDIVNYIAYMDGEHKYMFDEENIVSVLKNSGFTDVRLRDFDPELDLKEREAESIFAEARKP